MPDSRQHRGAHPKDRAIFAADQREGLRCAVAELSWLLGRGYSSRAALKLVGDRHHLVERQRTAVLRATCSDEARDERASRRIELAALAGEVLWIDGFNVLTSVEAALAGGVILRARDGCLRDMASVHGSWRRVAETRAAIATIGAVLASAPPGTCRWLLDRPVSNSGRLRGLLLELAAEQGWCWEVALEWSPDRVLRDHAGIVASADSAVLDACGRWLNLAREVIESRVPRAWLLDLGGGALSSPRL